MGRKPNGLAVKKPVTMPDKTHVWMAPDLQEFFSRDEQWSLAVMCPAFQCGLT